MSVARPAARSLLSRGLASTSCKAGGRAGAIIPTTTPSTIRRCPRAAVAAAAPFHSSATLETRRKPRFKSVRADEMGLTTPEKVAEFTKKAFPDYTPEELEVLRKRYTPEQMAALEAGEAAIDPTDLTLQGRLRSDPYRLDYLDDFAKIHPTIDKQPKKKQALPPPKTTIMTEEESVEELEQLLRSLLPKDVNFEGMTIDEMKALLDERQIDFAMAQAKYFEGDVSTMSDYKETTNSSLAPELQKPIAGVEGRYKAPQAAEDKGRDPQGRFQDLKKRTGLSLQEIFRIPVKLLIVRLVSNQTRLGKIQSAWVMAIAGNGDGRLGLGVAKSVSTDQNIALRKAKQLAVQNLRPVRRYEDRTIFGSVQAKFGSTIVKLDARPPGFGLRVSRRFFEIFRMCGIKDISARMPRGRNPMNSVKACVAALQSQHDPQELAIGRGKKLVDVRKVYYGGNPL